MQAYPLVGTGSAFILYRMRCLLSGMGSCPFASIAVQYPLPQSKACIRPVAGNSCRQCRGGWHSPGMSCSNPQIRPLLDDPLITIPNDHSQRALQLSHWLAKNRYQPHLEDVGEPAGSFIRPAPQPIRVRVSAEPYFQSAAGTK